MTDSRTTLSSPPMDRVEAETNSLAMWIFLAGEVMFFGALFMAYTIYRGAYPQVFAEGSHHLNLVLGGINTALLLTSSFTMALAVRAAQTGRHRELVITLLLTLLFAAAFLGIKAFEYYTDFNDHLYPGYGFSYPGPYANQIKLFFSLYFTMTGLHAIHMLIGMAIISVLAFLSWRRKIGPQNYSVVELTGLFWHFVDIIWIFLYPLLYLIH